MQRFSVSRFLPVNPSRYFSEPGVKHRILQPRSSIWQRNFTDTLSRFDIFGGQFQVNKIRVEGYFDGGFMLNNELPVKGPILLLNKLAFKWSVNSLQDVTPDSLHILTLTTPPVEILIVGTGRKMQLLDRTVVEFLRDRGISYEPMNTGAAIGTFNTLNQEDRRVAACLFPVDSES